MGADTVMESFNDGFLVTMGIIAAVGLSVGIAVAVGAVGMVMRSAGLYVRAGLRVLRRRLAR